MVPLTSLRESPDPSTGRSIAGSRRFLLAVLLPQLAIMALSAGVMLVSERDWRPGYDEYWHILLAEVEPPSQVFDDLHTVWHPPLTFLANRLFTESGDPPLTARLLSMLCGLLTLPLFYALGRKLDLPRPLAHLGSFILGTAHVFISMSICVRAYSAGVFLVLLALLPFLDLLRSPADFRRLQLFLLVLALLLAVWSAYTTGVVIFAMGGALLLRSLLSPTYRRALRTRLCDFNPIPEALFLTLGLGGLLLYYRWTERSGISYLAEYFPKSGDSWLDYFLRGLGRDLSCFTPLSFPDDGWLAPALFLTIVLALAAWHLSGPSRARDPARAAPPLILLLTVLLLFLAGWLGKHPFGGKMRHQYILFPSLLLTALVALDLLFRRLRTARTRWLLAAALALCAATSAWRDHQGPQVEEFARDLLWQRDFQRLLEHLESEDAVLVSAFSQVGFYANSRNTGPWICRTTTPAVDGLSLDLFDATAGSRRILVLRDPRWVFPASPEPSFASDLRLILETLGLRRLWIFSRQVLPERLPEDRPAHVAELDRVLARSGLRLARHFWQSQGETYVVARD